jgi:hypothetical protein
MARKARAGPEVLGTVEDHSLSRVSIGGFFAASGEFLASTQKRRWVLFDGKLNTGPQTKACRFLS